MAPVLDSGVFTAPHASAAVSLNDICFSSACVQTAASLLQSMDMNIDPCSDFYQYTCKIIIAISVNKIILVLIFTISFY